MAAFWLAILLQLLFSMWLGVTPVQGRIDGWGPDPITGFFTVDAVLRGDWETLGQALLHLILPTLTLALPAIATIVRFTRAGMINVMSSNFVFYQTAMGIPRRRIVWKYLLRAALIGTLTQIGLIFGNLIAGAVVVETVFDWPGLGSFAVNSILHSDYNAVMSFTRVRRRGVHPDQSGGRYRANLAGSARPMKRLLRDRSGAVRPDHHRRAGAVRGIRRPAGAVPRGRRHLSSAAPVAGTRAR